MRQWPRQQAHSQTGCDARDASARLLDTLTCRTVTTHMQAGQQQLILISSSASDVTRVVKRYAPGPKNTNNSAQLLPACTMGCK